jgi:hypothetical protein
VSRGRLDGIAASSVDATWMQYGTVFEIGAWIEDQRVWDSGMCWTVLTDKRRVRVLVGSDTNAKLTHLGIPEVCMR